MIGSGSVCRARAGAGRAVGWLALASLLAPSLSACGKRAHQPPENLVVVVSRAATPVVPTEVVSRAAAPVVPTANVTAHAAPTSAVPEAHQAIAPYVTKSFVDPPLPAELRTDGNLVPLPPRPPADQFAITMRPTFDASPAPQGETR